MNPRKQYRTYTYSEGGYRKLLRDAGFAATSSYWADPGYNQPYRLVPLAVPKWVRQHSVELLDHPGAAPRRSWRRRLKRIAVPVSPWLVADFVLLASKQPGRRTRLQTWIDERLATFHGMGRSGTSLVTWALHTGAFKEKSIVRLGDARTGSDLAYLKIFTGEQQRREPFETELANRAKAEESLKISGTSLVRVPQSYGTLQIGKTAYYMEAASRGAQVSGVIRQLGYFGDARRVERDFSQISDGIIELTSALQNVSGVPTISPTWREIPETTSHSPGVDPLACRQPIFSRKVFGVFCNLDSAWRSFDREHSSRPKNRTVRCVRLGRPGRRSASSL